MTVLDPDDLDLCTVVFATAAYSVASLDEILPRTGDVTSDGTRLTGLAAFSYAFVVGGAVLTSYIRAPL